MERLDHSRSAKPSQFRRTGIVIALVISALLAIVFGSLVLPANTGPSVMWLTAAKAEQVMRGGEVLRFRDEIRIWLAQRLKRFPVASSNVRISLSMATISPGVQWPELGTPAATNEAGVRVWILSAEQFKTFKQRAESTPGLRSLYAPMIEPKRGGVGRIMLADVLPPVASNQPPLAPGYSNTYFGPEIRILPLFLPGETRLVVAFKLTAFTGWTVSSGVSVPAITTNVWLACQLPVPADGGVVIRAPATNGPNLPDSIFLVSPYLTDTNGRPVKY